MFQKTYFSLIFIIFIINYTAFAQFDLRSAIEKSIDEARYENSCAQFKHCDTVSNKNIAAGNWNIALKYADSMQIISRQMTQPGHQYDKIFANAQALVQQAKIFNYKHCTDICLYKYNAAREHLIKNYTDKASFAQCDTFLVYTYSEMLHYMLTHQAEIEKLDLLKKYPSINELCDAFEKYPRKKPLFNAEYHKIRGDVYLMHSPTNLYNAKTQYKMSLMYLNNAYQKRRNNAHYLHQQAALHSKMGLVETNKNTIEIHFAQAIDILKNLCATYPTNNDYQQDLTAMYIAKIEKYVQQSLYTDSNNTDLAADALKVDGFLQYSYQERRKTGAFDYPKWSSFTPDTLINALDSNNMAIKILRTYTNHTKSEVVYHALIFYKNATQPIQYVKIWQGDTEKEDDYIKIWQDTTRTKDDVYQNNKLYTELWQPIHTAIKDLSCNTIYFSATGIYNQINIEALSNEKQYLIQNYTIYHLDALRNASTHRKTTLKPDTKIMLCGQPQYICMPNEKKDLIANEIDREQRNRNRLADLYFANKEQQNLFNTFKNYKPYSLSKEAVTKQNLIQQIPNYNVLWLIGHGGKSDVATKNTLDSNGFYTYCKNSTDSTEKRHTVFTGNDAANLVLNQTELVVLSTCNGNQGELIDYEGAYSLAHGFKMAGAKAVIASFNKVNDKQTYEFMAIFAKHIVSEKSYFDAFRKAKLACINNNLANNVWQDFILIE